MESNIILDIKGVSKSFNVKWFNSKDFKKLKNVKCS